MPLVTNVSSVFLDLLVNKDAENTDVLRCHAERVTSYFKWGNPVISTCYPLHNKLLFRRYQKISLKCFPICLLLRKDRSGKMTDHFVTHYSVKYHTIHVFFVYLINLIVSEPDLQDRK